MNLRKIDEAWPELNNFINRIRYNVLNENNNSLHIELDLLDNGSFRYVGFAKMYGLEGMDIVMEYANKEAVAAYVILADNFLQIKLSLAEEVAVQQAIIDGIAQNDIANYAKTTDMNNLYNQICEAIKPFYAVSQTLFARMSEASEPNPSERTFLAYLKKSKEVAKERREIFNISMKKNNEEIDVQKK